VHPGLPRTAYDVTPELLASHLRWLRRLRIEIVPLVDLVAALDRESTGARMAAVTFDDALAGVHTHGLEVLRAAKVPATMFVVTDRLDTKPSWWPEAGPTMSAAALDDVVAAGVELGSHTRTHRRLPDLDDRDLADELCGSKKALEDQTGRPVTMLAYPDGHHDGRVRAAAAHAGYRAAFTFLNGRAEPAHDRYQLPRLTMGPRHRTLRLLAHLLRPARTWPSTQLDSA
jgi:peptidoglycan/xylan/chitin deacetylase (PgdA/CDA1 family)